MGFIFVVVPIIFYCIGDVPSKGVLKESLSLLIIIGFFITIALAYLIPSSQSILAFLGSKAIALLRVHKIIGYTFSCVILLHPLLLVFPKFFEAGVTPYDALITIITTYNTGIIVGIVAWLLLFTLMVSSYLRSTLPLSYRSWVKIHASLAISFLVCSLWHVIELGRHMYFGLALYGGILVGLACVKIFHKYTIRKSKQVGE